MEEEINLISTPGKGKESMFEVIIKITIIIAIIIMGNNISRYIKTHTRTISYASNYLD